MKATVAIHPWNFGEDIDSQFMHDTFEQLVTDLKAFTDPKTGVVASIDERLALSRTIKAKTVIAQAQAWHDSVEGIKASPKYSGLAIKPQIGLIPLGPDPQTGYFEFLHLLSHDPEASLPVRNDKGRFDVKAETGIILVLLPGGEFMMGSQKEDESKPNYDPQSRSNESPAHQVTLDPFFLAKYEVTRGQWVRMSGEADPSNWGPDTSGGRLKATDLPRLPVEQVTWTMSDRATRRVGLLLPTEAQWESGCRAGSEDVFFFGSDVSRMTRYANVADLSYKSGFGATARSFENIDDGHAVTAPVGSYDPNGFGLHDRHGNVGEWCLDWHRTFAADNVEKGPGLRRGKGSRIRVLRGGSFFGRPVYLRSAFRVTYKPSYRNFVVGFRVARTHP